MECLKHVISPTMLISIINILSYTWVFLAESCNHKTLNAFLNILEVIQLKKKLIFKAISLVNKQMKSTQEKGVALVDKPRDIFNLIPVVQHHNQNKLHSLC